MKWILLSWSTGVFQLTCDYSFLLAKDTWSWDSAEDIAGFKKNKKTAGGQLSMPGVWHLCFKECM